MSILLYGATGQIGRHIAVQPGVTPLTREMADLRDPSRAAEAILDAEVTAVINATGIQDAIVAEQHAGRSFLMNARVPRALSLAAAQRGIPIIHFSNPSVFGGEGNAPYAPDADLSPTGVLGRSKAAGEASVCESGAPHAVIRSSWVFSDIEGGFAHRLLLAARRNTRLTIVDDDIAAPTPAQDLAAFAVHVARALIDTPDQSGVYHFAGAGDVSSATLARRIIAEANAECEVDGRPGRDLPFANVRIGNGRLDCKSSEQVFGVTRPRWEPALGRVIADLGEAGSQPVLQHSMV